MENLEQAVSSLARANFLPFCMAIYSDYKISWHLRLLGNLLEKVEKGEIKRLMVSCPPRHSKSWTISELFPAWYLGRNPNKQIICATHSQSFASDFGRKVRNNISSDAFKLIFPGVSLSQDSQSKDLFHTSQGGVYAAVGVGGGVGRGANLLCIDDPHRGRQEAESEAERKQVIDWYYSVARMRLMPGGAIAILHTRWRDDDLIGTLLEHSDDEWTVVQLPAIAEEDEEHRKKGEALWPNQWSKEELLALKRELDSQGKIEEWYSQYQQNPLNEENAEFKKNWFQYYTEDTNLPNMSIYTTVDPAISKKKEADESCVMTVGVNEKNEKYILEYTHGKWNPHELIEQIFYHHNKYKPRKVGIETVAYQEAIVHFMKDEMKKRNQFMSIEEIKTRQNKEEKIRGLISHYKAGAVYHKKGMCEELENQMLRFPKGRRDDILDCLAMSVKLWKSNTGGGQASTLGVAGERNYTHSVYGYDNTEVDMEPLNLFDNGQANQQKQNPFLF